MTVVVTSAVQHLYAMIINYRLKVINVSKMAGINEEKRRFLDESGQDEEDTRFLDESLDEETEEEDFNDPDFWLEDSDVDENDDVASDAVYIGQVCGIDDLIAQINLHSRCKATFNCNGVYQRTGIKTRGLGGAIEIFYNCSECKKRSFTFKSSSDHCDLPGTIDLFHHMTRDNI